MFSRGSFQRHGDGILSNQLLGVSLPVRWVFLELGMVYIRSSPFDVPLSQLFLSTSQAAAHGDLLSSI
jgi:hypothetical protein